MSKFKVGDRVRCVGDDWPALEGDTGIVTGTGSTGILSVNGRLMEERYWDLDEPTPGLLDAPATVSYEPPPGFLDWAKNELLYHEARRGEWVEGFDCAIRCILLRLYGLSTAQTPAVAATVEFVKVPSDEKGAQ